MLKSQREDYKDYKDLMGHLANTPTESRDRNSLVSSAQGEDESRGLSQRGAVIPIGDFPEPENTK